MTICHERPRAVTMPEVISVITNATLLARRIRELQRRRRAIAEQQEQLRTQLPDWAAEPLRLIGMSNDEIRGLVADLSTVEAEAGLDEVEQQPRRDRSADRGARGHARATLPARSTRSRR